MQKTNGTINGSNKMISVNTLLYDIYELLANVEMQDEDRILELIMQAASKFYNHKYYERAFCLRLVSENRADLPSDYLAIRSVMGKSYNCDSQVSMGNLQLDTSTTNNTIQMISGLSDATTNNTNVDYKYNSETSASKTLSQITTSLQANSWKHLYPGTSIMLKLQEEIDRLISSGCTDDTQTSTAYCHECTHLFSVDTLGRLVTTINTGLVLVEYIRFPKNENDELLIPYHHDIQDAVNAYVLYKLSVVEFNKGIQGGQQRMQYWQAQWQSYYLNVKNSLLMPSLSEQIHAVKNRDMFSKDPSSIFSDQVMNPTVRF
jgi:hypothetical protein